jgi:hypothetical protein
LCVGGGCVKKNLLGNVFLQKAKSSWAVARHAGMDLTSSMVGGEACFLKRLLNPNTGKHSLIHNMRKMEACRKMAWERRMADVLA